MATGNRDRLGVGHRLTNVVCNLAGAIFPNWFANVVRVGAIFPHWLANGVANFTRLGFPHWLADGIGAGAFFPHWLANGVANFFAVVFPNRLAHGVAAGFGFPHWLAHGVADLAGFGFPHWLAHGVATGFGFPNRFAHGVANFTAALLGYILHAIDDPVFADSFPARFVTSKLLLFVFDAVDCFHDRVRLYLAARVTTAVTCDSAESGCRLGWSKRQRGGSG